MDVLTVAGFQVPLMPLAEVDGNAGAVLFWHSGPICAKLGVIFELTVIVKVVVVAH